MQNTNQIRVKRAPRQLQQKGAWTFCRGGFFHETRVGSSVFLRLASGSSPPSSWLLIPFRACGPKRETCLLVIWRPALSFGPQCLSGFGRNRATFLACALLRDATALAKLACGERVREGKRIFECFEGTYKCYNHRINCQVLNAHPLYEAWVLQKLYMGTYYVRVPVFA